MRMKRLLCLLLVPVLLLLAACGAPKGETNGETSPDGYHVVTFSVDGTETKLLVADGETPVYSGKTEWETAEHYYKITGWDKEIVPAKSDATYTATIGEYGLTVYDIRFNLKSGIFQGEAHEGEIPTPPTGFDTPYLTVDKIYTFNGWDKELVAPTAENMAGKKFVMYTAKYSSETRYYSVTFKVGEAEYPLSVAANDTPVCPVSPEEAGGEELFFAGWDKEVVPATADETYNAVYMSADCPTTFTVATWNIGHFANGNAANSKISSSEYEAKSEEYRQYIEGLGADILCVNEYSRQFTSTGDRLAQDALFRTTPPIYYAGPQRHFSCNAVFSTLPLRNIQVHDFECNQGVTLLYSNTNKAEYYYYLTAELIVGGETVHFVFTHLAFDDDRDPDTVCQAQIDELIDLYKDVDRVVMMGDWNAYYKSYFVPFDEAGYTLGNYGETLTCTGSKTGGLEWAVDDIIVKGLTMTDFRAVKTGLSDHIAVVATLTLTEE